MIEELRAWLKPTAKSVKDTAFNDAKEIMLNRDPGTENAAIAAGWYPVDGGVAGSQQVEVPKPAWMPKGKTKE